MLGQPATDLSPYIRGYSGYREQTASFESRLEVPTGEVVLIISFGAGYALEGPWSGDQGTVQLQSFVGGIHDGPATVQATGLQHCLQVDFTPLGAYRFFRQPMHALANRVIALDDLLETEGRSLPERLFNLPGWEARFAAIDQLIRQRLALDDNLCPATAWAWREIERLRGQLSAGQLAEEIGWSHKHLVARFRDQVGLPPKRLARIVRFREVVRHLDEAVERPAWGDLAHDFGYFDQAHFNREFRALSGLTPGDYWRRLLPNHGGVIGD